MIDEKKLKRDDLCDICNSADCANCFSDSDFEKWINAQPKVGEWIPCSERLPEKTSSYLVTTIAADAFGKPYYVMDVALYNIIYGWTLNNKKCEEIFAWQPLPEPWGGEE